MAILGQIYIFVGNKKESKSQIIRKIKTDAVVTIKSKNNLIV